MHSPCNPHIEDYTEIFYMIDKGNISSRLLTLFFNNTLARTTQKTAIIIKEACLVVRYLAINVLLLNAYASSRCLAMDIHITLLNVQDKGLGHCTNPKS
jgi:hypothetical protein